MFQPMEMKTMEGEEAVETAGVVGADQHAEEAEVEEVAAGEHRGEETMAVVNFGFCLPG